MWRYGGVRVSTVYPRVGGGNPIVEGTFRYAHGLSPRGRGKHQATATNGSIWGSIPAWAGETGVAAGAVAAREVYPRVGGGNSVRLALDWPGAGLSPRGRGKHRPAPRPQEQARSIPAWAGETSAKDRPRRRASVYPRVGGGNRGWMIGSPPSGGLSPRGRGKQPSADAPATPSGSIPAWAGETAPVSP